MDFSSRWTRWIEMLRGLSEARALRVALFVWVVYAVIIAGIVAAQPDRRTVTPEYREASEKWWASQPRIYTERNGFLYLPQAAILYTPFALLPKPVGEPLWRLVMLATLAAALWMGAKKLGGQKCCQFFLIATLLVLPSSFASARNGQVNMLLAATYLLAGFSIAARHWWKAALFFTIALALKPISLAPILLAAVAFPHLIIPLIVGTVLLVGLSFAHSDPSYVIQQYKDFWECCVSNGGRPTGHSWCDIAGMFRTFGWQPGHELMWVTRALAALLALGLALRAARRPDPIRASLSVMLVGGIYLMLFNPRTETNSYVILAAFIALAGAYEFVTNRSSFRTWAFVGLAIVWGSENYGWPIFPLTNLWLKALCTTGLLVWLVPSILRAREPQPFLPPPDADSKKSGVA
jgi:hypothetical protein